MLRQLVRTGIVRSARGQDVRRAVAVHVPGLDEGSAAVDQGKPQGGLERESAGCGEEHGASDRVVRVRDAFARHQVRYLFIGKSAAILLGFPDTTQDADLFVEKTPENGRAIVAALRELGFALSDEQAGQIERGKDFVQIKSGPFDVDLAQLRLGGSDGLGHGVGPLRTLHALTVPH